MLRNRRTGHFRQKPLPFWLLVLPILPLSTLAAGCFYFQAAANQLSLINDQTPLARAIQEETDPTRREFLKRVPQILSFADNVILLSSRGSYRGYVDLQRHGLTYVLSAAPTTTLEPYRWWFPIAGSIEYKSYFSKEAAVAAQEALERSGYDTYLGTSQAYSTLGYLRDPITNTMMAGSFDRFVEVLIHELAHRRLYIPGRTEFNEQLASFVGQEGTRQFFRQAEFRGSGWLAQVQARHRRERCLEQSVAQVALELKHLYESDLSDEEKRIAREPYFARLQQIQQGLTGVPSISNNAVLLQALRYRKNAPELRTLWQRCDRSWPCFWKQVEAQVNDVPTPSIPQPNTAQTACEEHALHPPTANHTGGE